MKFFSRFLTVMGLTISMVGGLGSLPAIADTQNPVVVVGSGVVSPSTAAPGGSVTLTYRVTDDLDCCNPHDAYMYDSAGNWVVRNQASMVSGTKTDGTYRVVFSIPSNLSPGTYTFKSQVTDKAGKYSHLQQLGSVTIASSQPTDTQNPVVVVGSGVVSPSTAAPGGSVTLTYRVTDDLDCCNPHDAYMYDSAGNWVVRNQASMVSGTKTDGTYRVVFSIPSNLSPGTYTFKSQVTDKAGKYSHLQQLGSVTIASSQPTDTQNPVVVVGSGVVSPSTAAPGGSVTLTYRVTDDLDCCNPHDAYMYDSAGNWVVRNQASMVSGTKTDGTYRVVFSIPSNLSPGTYTFKSQVTDKAGKYSHLQQLGSVTIASSQPTDTQNPVVVVGSGVVSPSTAAPGGSVTLTYRVTDDLDCCNPHDAYMYDSAGNWVVRNQASMVSGTKTDGTYRVVFSIPSNLSPGTYTFKSQVTDKAGKYSHLQQLGSVTIASSQPTDTQNPVVVVGSGVVSPSTAAPGGSVTLTYRVTDDLDCCNPHDAYMYDSAGNWVVRNQASMVSGTKTDGTYRVVFSIPSNLSPGTYTFKSQVTDKAGKYSHLQQLGSVTIASSQPTDRESSSVGELEDNEASKIQEDGPEPSNNDRQGVEDISDRTSETASSDEATQATRDSMKVQIAGSQLVIYAEEPIAATYEVLEDGKSLGKFTLDQSTKAHVIEQRVTGKVTINRTDTESEQEVAFAPTRSLLWYQNYNLGLVSPSALNSVQRTAVDRLAESYKAEKGTWKPRGQSTSKFICTGIYGPRASFADKVDARKRAKVACDTAQAMNPGSDVSFWFQTKETKALSYVNKVLVTVKGLETFVEESLG